ncbi:unnamed protein product, partial [Polarella glacialis]
WLETTVPQMSVPPHLPPEANAPSQVDGDVPKDELCESDAESVDDKACDVCGGTEDKALFLLCDGNGGDCPGACHTFCDGLGNTVPDGDWFCRRCRASAPSAPEPLRHLACQQGQVKAQDVSRTHARPARLPQPAQDNDVEIVAEKGMRGPAADVPAGSQVFRHYRILRNAAAGWQVLGRLEMDRHKGQQTSRAPRWRYVHPDGQTSFVSINKQKSRSNSTSVESSGISVEGFEHLKKVQKSLMAVLCRRRDELVQVGSLIDERVEADWQQILMQRGGNSVRVQELRRNYASKVEKAPSAPEWRPPRWEASEAQCPPSLRRPGCIPTTSEGFVSSRKRGPDFSAAESALRPGPRPLRRYHDPFLRYIMSNAPQAPASEVDPDAGAEPDADAEPDALAEPEQEGNGRKQPRVGDRLAAGCEDAGEHQDAEQREARRRQSVSVQRLVKDPLAAERELKLHAGRTPWGRLLQLQGGQLGEGEGYDSDEFKEELKDEPMGAEGAEKPQPHEELARLFATEPDLQEVAWRCLIAATALGRATDQLPFVCVDLLKADACMRGGSAVKHFVRVLSVRDAMLAAEARLPKDLAVAADAPDMASFVTTVLRHFATCPPEENIDEASEALNCRFAGLRQFMADFRSDRRAAPYKALALKSQAYDKLGQLCAFTILLYSPLQATIQASKREAGKWSGNDAVARLLKQPCKWPLRRQGIAVLLGSFLSAVDRTGLTILMDLLESPSEWPTSDEDVRWGIARWELWVTLMQVIGRLAVELSGKPVEAPACFRIPAWWLGSSTTPRALEAVLEAWRDLLDALPKLTNGKDALLRILAATASSPAPRELAAELLQGLQGTRSSPAEAWALTRLLEVWEQEARALLPLASPSSGFEAVAAEWVLRASLCFEALCSRARCAARPLRPGARNLLEAAGEACAAGMALLVRTGNAAAVEKLVSFLPSSGESGRHRWHVPTESAEQKSAFFRAAGDPSGPSFNVDNKLHRFNGCRFSEKWALEKHITREAAEATTQSATAAAIKASTKAGAAAKKASLNPEVNRFARWILEDVLNYCPPLLRLPSRRAGELLAPLAPLDEELAGMAARAQAVCSSRMLNRTGFGPLLWPPAFKPAWLQLAHYRRNWGGHFFEALSKYGKLRSAPPDHSCSPRLSVTAIWFSQLVVSPVQIDHGWLFPANAQLGSLVATLAEGFIQPFLAFVGVRGQAIGALCDDSAGCFVTCALCDDSAGCFVTSASSAGLPPPPEALCDDSIGAMRCFSWLLCDALCDDSVDCFVTSALCDDSVDCFVTSASSAGLPPPPEALCDGSVGCFVTPPEALCDDSVGRQRRCAMTLVLCDDCAQLQLLCRRFVMIEVTCNVTSASFAWLPQCAWLPDMLVRGYPTKSDTAAIVVATHLVAAYLDFRIFFHVASASNPGSSADDGRQRPHTMAQMLLELLTRVFGEGADNGVWKRAFFARETMGGPPLEAGLVSCAVEPDLGMAVRGAIGELLAVALGVADVRVALAADVALAQAAALSGPLLAWVFAGLARDLHQLLLLVDGLEKPAAGVRAKALFRLAAVSARRIGGQWPTPPAFPAAVMPRFRLHLLVFNPMRDAFPPGADSSMAISARILQCRPLASLLAYLAPPERGMHLSSFSGLELSVQAAASVPSHSLSAWAAALTGSDLEDFVRLREWRSQTYASLMEQGQFVTLRKLQAAVSSRMVAVHCAVELSRARLHTAGPSEQRVNSLVQALLRDLGESTFEKALLEHTSATREILAGHSPRVAEQAGADGNVGQALVP